MDAGTGSTVRSVTPVATLTSRKTHAVAVPALDWAFVAVTKNVTSLVPDVTDAMTRLGV